MCQIGLIVALIAMVGVVTYATNLLWNSAHSTTSLSKGRYIEVSLSGAEATGSIRPGGTLSLSSVLTNNGDINCIGLVKLNVPVVNGSSAYDYVINSSWTLVDADDTAGVYVYGYGSDSELNELSPGSSTDLLMETGFTMKSSITGAELNAMGEIDISVDGLLVDAEAGVDPVSVLGMVQ